jgi:uncharacterized protein YqgQ
MHIFYVVSFLFNLYGYQDNEDDGIVMLSLRTSELYFYNILYWRSLLVCHLPFSREHQINIYHPTFPVITLIDIF